MKATVFSGDDMAGMLSASSKLLRVAVKTFLWSEERQGSRKGNGESSKRVSNSEDLGEFRMHHP